MNPAYYFTQYFPSAIVTPQFLQQSSNLDTFNEHSRPTVLQLNPKAFVESKIRDDPRIEYSVLQPPVIGSNSFVTHCSGYEMLQPRASRLVNVPQMDSPFVPHFSKPAVYQPRTYQRVGKSDFCDSNSQYVSDKPSYMTLTPPMSINLPPSFNIDPNKPPTVFQPKEKLADKLNNLGNHIHPVISEKPAIEVKSPGNKPPVDNCLDSLINQMDTKLRLELPQCASADIEHRKEICSKRCKSARMHRGTFGQSKSVPLESANDCENPLTPARCKTKTSNLISDETTPVLPCSVASQTNIEKATSMPKTPNSAVVVASLPKLRSFSPSKQVLKRSDAVLSVPSTSRPSSDTGNGGRRQGRDKHLENKLRLAAVFFQVERPTALKKLQKRRQERKNRMARIGITPEQREHLLTRYRSRLEEQIIHKNALPQTLLGEVQKRKRHTRLKAGIIRDRIARRAFRSLLQQRQQILESGEEPSDQVKIITPIIPPKVVKIVLPILPDLEEQVKEMLERLAGFQDRAFKNAPAKRKNTRRIVCGFHEVIKSLKVKKLKFLIIANDLEKGAYEIEVEGAAVQDDELSQENQPPKNSNTLSMTLKQAVDMAHEQCCPVIKAFKRRHLQKMCHKGAPVSCVGVINVAGAEDIAKNLKEGYQQKVDAPRSSHSNSCHHTAQE
ncbi:hypothetical protein Aperf_G00000070742 [Anoplocephala perfoliata]